MRPVSDDDAPEEDLTQLVSVGGRCSYVLLALFAVILLYPDLSGSTWGRGVIAFLMSTVVVAIAYAVGRSRRQLMIASAFAIALLGLQWTFFASGNRVVFAIGVAMFLAFIGFAMTQLFAYLMRHGPVTGDKLHAALCIYILGAFLWAGMYTLLYELEPRSFLASVPQRAAPDFYDMLYFSFTTLTSTGYGDLTPATRRAESLAILEQVAGVFYVAVLIARLAGLYPPGAPPPEPDRQDDSAPR